MPSYEYIVRTQDGKRLEGKIEAENLNRANEKLEEKKFTIVKLKENEVAFDFLGPFLDRLNLEMENLKIEFHYQLLFSLLVNYQQCFQLDLH